MRICFNVDRGTHRYLIEELSDSIHPKVMLCSRYVSFQQSLLKCEKFPVRYLARLQQADQRTVFGRTLCKISQECGNGQQVQKAAVKRTMKYYAVPEAEVWRPSLLRDLLRARKDISTLPGFSLPEVEEMIQFVCIS